VRFRIFRSPSRAALVAAAAVGVIVTLIPANGAARIPAGGAARDIAAGFAWGIRHLADPARGGHPFAGTPAVGALFTTSAGRPSQHFCTASVIDSSTPYGVWTVTRIYVDRAWSSSASQDDDFAFLRVSNPGSGTPVEDETGAEKLLTGTPASGEQASGEQASGELVQAIGYPNATEQPITCRNWLREPMRNQLEFDCDGYTNGTSGGPFLSRVDPATGQGLLIGVIGGYQQGGNTPQVSYSAVLGGNAAALYSTAVAGG